MFIPNWKKLIYYYYEHHKISCKNFSIIKSEEEFIYKYLYIFKKKKGYAYPYISFILPIGYFSWYTYTLPTEEKYKYQLKILLIKYRISGTIETCLT